MPELIPHAPDNPDFARVVMVRKLGDVQRFDFDISPDPEEAARLASLLGALSLRKFRFAGRLTPLSDGQWQLEGQLGATVVQTCVVSLEPVSTRIDEAVRRTFLSGASATGEIVVSPDDDDDEVEPLSDRIDLGRIATEALALAMPAYPRKEGATLAPGVEPVEVERPRPFAALEVLRGKLGPGGA